MMNYGLEMDKLETGLIERNIPYVRSICFDGWQITCDDWDVICHKYSYGHERGLLEVMGTPVIRADDDTVEGYLTAATILNRLDKIG